MAGKSSGWTDDRSACQQLGGRKPATRPPFPVVLQGLCLCRIKILTSVSVRSHRHANVITVCGPALSSIENAPASRIFRKRKTGAVGHKDAAYRELLNLTQALVMDSSEAAAWKGCSRSTCSVAPLTRRLASLIFTGAKANTTYRNTP